MDDGSRLPEPASRPSGTPPTAHALVSTREAARLLGNNVRSVRRAIERGDLPAVMRGSAYRIAVDDLMRFAARTAPRARPPARGQLVAFPAPMRGYPALPEPLSSFVGRTTEIEQIGDLLAEPAVRLLTLTGPGGIGKTRLALAVATAVRDLFPDGVVFAGLAGVSRAGQVLPAIFQALGLREAAGRDRRAQLHTFLAEKRLLLVLDNLEHLLEAAPEIAELPRHARSITLLVTSRAPLRVAGERAFPLTPLSVPAAEASTVDLLASDAARLFIERVLAHDPAFTIDETTAPLIAEVCARLDGLPLAIELAAARVPMLPPRALRDRLERSLPLLTTGPRDAPHRHRTMRDAITWSYNLLTPDEQTLFRRLAVFTGGFTLEGAAGVAYGLGDDGPAYPVDLVGRLLEQSLLSREAGPAGEPRFAMLETVREYGLERLERGEAEEARAAHAQHVCAVANSLRPLANTQAARAPFERLAATEANLRAALAWLHQQGPAADFAGLTAACWIYWYAAGRLQEAERWIGQALAQREAVPLTIRARLTIVSAERLMVTGETTQAVAAFDEGLALTRAAGDPFDLAMALRARAALANVQGAFADAERYLAEAGTLASQIADVRLSAAVSGSILGNLSVSALGQEQPDRAATLLQDELQLIAGLGFDLMEIRCLIGLADVARVQGDYLQMAERYRQGLERMSEQDEPRVIAEALSGVAIAAAIRGQLQTALLLFGAAAAVRDRAGGGMVLPDDAAAYQTHLRQLREALGEERFSAVWAEGRALSFAESTTLAGRILSSRGGPPRERLLPSTALTPREQDVLRLLADGQTDRQIAAALYISPRTVSWHVGTILGKLDAGTRRDAVTRARERGLL